MKCQHLLPPAIPPQGVRNLQIVILTKVTERNIQDLGLVVQVVIYQPDPEHDLIWGKDQHPDTEVRFVVV